MSKSRKKAKRQIFKRFVKLLYPLYLSIIQPLRSHPLLIRYLFKVRLYKGEKVSWDFTTLALKHALYKRLSRHHDSNISVLEIGVGQAALLCIYLARKFGIKADGVDIVADRVSRSNRAARYNSIPLRIWRSDFFQKIEGKYDLIFWNASYIPTGFGEHYNLTGREDLGDKRAWDGGSDGTHAIKRFLNQAPRYLTPNGEILLGVNTFYVSKTLICQILRDTFLVTSERISTPFNPSAVYVLRYKKKDNKETPNGN
jgi:release factor glutamine methyltransferase